MKVIRLFAFATPVLLGLELAPENWESATKAGTKDVFLKFFSPTCGHCKKMKPDWDQLMDEYDGDKKVVVAEVDCKGSGDAICLMAEVKSHPTILYGNPNGKDVESLKKYTGPRTYAAFHAFAVENFGAPKVCDAFRQSGCDVAEKALIATLLEKEDATLLGLIVENSIKMQKITDEQSKLSEEIGASMEPLQSRFQDIKSSKKQKDKDEVKQLEDQMADIKERYLAAEKQRESKVEQFGEGVGLRFMKQILEERNPEMAASAAVAAESASAKVEKSTPKSTAGSTKPAGGAKSVSGFGLQFTSAVSMAAVKKKIAAENKAAIVFVTQPTCGACVNLKASVAKNLGLKKDLDNYILVHAEGDAGKQWHAPGETDGYIPRVYFLDAQGKFLDIKGPNKKYSHFFSSADDLVSALPKMNEDDDFDPDFATEDEDPDYDPDLAVKDEL